MPTVRSRYRPCSCVGCDAHEGSCPQLTESGRCPSCRSTAERRRGTAYERGYGGKRWQTRRRACLERDPICVCTDPDHGHGPRCYTEATVADHYPRTRRELVAAGAPDPDALDLLRGVCKPCHDRHTGVSSPGGWHRP